jgi:hypothetical protein
MSYDTEKAGSIPIDVVARMLIKISLRWTQRTPYTQPLVERALRTLNIFDDTDTLRPEGEIGTKHLYHSCTTSHRTRRVLGGSMLRSARKVLKRNSGLMQFHPMLKEMPKGYLKRPASEMDREDFCRFLGALIPSLQPYEVAMCWEVRVNNEEEGRPEERAPRRGNFAFTITQMSASIHFRTALTFCIVLNAISMMLDDPVCNPVDSRGSELCIFNCVKVESSIVGHPCEATLEITRQQLEFLLLVIFSTEMGIMLFTLKYRYFVDTWNQIDFVVISFSWVSVFVDGPSIAVIRLVKLLRLLKAFKGYKKMQVIGERPFRVESCAVERCRAGPCISARAELQHTSRCALT